MTTRTRSAALSANAFVDDYYHTDTDIWGVEWGVSNFRHGRDPKHRPLDDYAALDSYQPPALPVPSGPAFEAERAAIEQHKTRFYALFGWINLFEILHAVRRFEDVLMDLAEDAPELHRLADLIVDYQLATVRYLLAQGMEAIMFVDDWGRAPDRLSRWSAGGISSSPATGRLMEPVRAAGKHVWYHTCGCTEWLWDDLAEVGMQVLWPQATCNDNSAPRRLVPPTQYPCCAPRRSFLMTKAPPTKSVPKSTASPTPSALPGRPHLPR